MAEDNDDLDDSEDSSSLPPWRARGLQPPPEVVNSATSGSHGATDSDEQVPEWKKKFQSMRKPSTEPSHAPPPKQQDQKEEEVPEWMKKFQTMKSKEASTSDFDHKSASDRSSKDGDDEENLPEWKKKLKKMQSKHQSASPVVEVKQLTTEDNVPEWKKKFNEMKLKDSPVTAESQPSVGGNGEEKVPEWSQNQQGVKGGGSAAAVASQQPIQVATAIITDSPPRETKEESSHVAAIGSIYVSEVPGEGVQEVLEELCEEGEDVVVVEEEEEIIEEMEDSQQGTQEGGWASASGVVQSATGDYEEEEIIEEVVEEDGNIYSYVDVEDEERPESQASTHVSGNMQAGIVEEFTSIPPAPAPDDEAEAYAQLHRPIPQQARNGLQSSFSAFRPPAQQTSGRFSETTGQSEQSLHLSHLSHPLSSSSSAQTSDRTSSAQTPSAQSSSLSVLHPPDPGGEHSSQGSAQIEPEGLAASDRRASISDDEAMLLDLAWENELRKERERKLQEIEGMEQSASEAKSEVASVEEELLRLTDFAWESNDEPWSDEPEERDKMVQTDQSLYIYRDERKRGTPWLFVLICLLFLGLVAASILLILALLELPPFDKDQTNKPSTVAPTSFFVGSQPTTPMEPYIPGKCPVPGQIQPNLLSQCACDGAITTLEEDARAKYEALRDEFIITIYPSWSFPIESCDPANQALVWLSTGYQNDELDLRQRYVLAYLYYSTEGTQWRSDDGWLSDTEVCMWYGIACTDNLITIVALENNRLSGSVSSYTLLAFLR
jgi:hypothetical protein